MSQPRPDADPREQQARDYVKSLREFWWLLLISLPVIATTAVVNWLTSPGRWWFVWVVFGLGVALLFKGVQLLGQRSFLGPEWEERKVREFLDRHPQ